MLYLRYLYRISFQIKSFRLNLWLFPAAFQQIGFICGNANKSLCGTSLCDGTLVTIDANIMAHLQMQRSITKSTATFHTFSAGKAKFFFDIVLIIRVFHVSSHNGFRRAKLFFSSCSKLLRIGAKIATTKIAISAHFVGMNRFYCRRT